jgi:predicted nucleotidyltransferase
MAATLNLSIEEKTEWYRLPDRRRQLAYIRKLCRQIVEAFHPVRIILFGSQAYGKPTDESDIDLLVIMPYEDSHITPAIKILNYLSVLAPIDLLVRSPEEVRERLNLGDSFIREITERGKVMYEADNRRMD